MITKKEKRKEKKSKKSKIEFQISNKNRLVLITAIIMAIASIMFTIAVEPVGPDGLVYGDNLTKANPNAAMVNISGGVISTFNLTANVQNPRWKAFVGHVDGSFALSDASGNNIYDWTLASVSGRVYASRANMTVDWANIDCASLTDLETENTALSHSGSSDNISATFRKTTHDTFFVGAKGFTQDYCNYTLNTYDETGADQDADFDEVALEDGSGNVVYATLIEDDAVGFDNNPYDFQMIVPENGSASWNGATPYYVYVEIVS